MSELLNNSNKIVFVSFQGIRNGIPQGTTKGLMYRTEYFGENVSKDTKLYVSFVSGYNGTADIRALSRIYWFLIKTISVVNRYSFGLPSYVIRFLQERLFDFFLSLKIKEPSIIISTAYLYLAQRKNKKMGGVNIFLAGNPDDRDIHVLLRQEQSYHKVSFNDAYTYKRRIGFISKALNLYDHIITFSSVTYGSYLKRIPVQKISLVHSNSIPSRQIFPPNDFQKQKEIIFCYIAHPFWLKGLPYLLEAWNKINPREAKLCIAGNINDDLQHVIDARFSNLAGVEYLGWVNNLNEFFRISHVAIIPSLLDAGPTTVAEAMYCGLPVIVSDACGSSELVKHGINGFIVPSGNSMAIAERIGWFTSNPERIDVMGKEATKTIEDLAKSDQNKNVTNHILSVIHQLQL
jgi:glycosyltransferase involved in cell wall biosynthesis